jgi:hypothetical protein
MIQTWIRHVADVETKPMLVLWYWIGFVWKFVVLTPKNHIVTHQDADNKNIYVVGITSSYFMGHTLVAIL